MNIARIQTARTDTWTSGQNPAALDQPVQWQMAAQYENTSMLSALNTASVQAAWCNPYVNMGIGFRFFGYSKYHEMSAEVALSHRFGRFVLGIGGSYTTLYAGDDLKYRGTVVPIIGCAIDVSKNATIGLFTSNPFMQQIRITDDERRRLPAIYSIGTDYRFYKGFHWSTQIDYDPTTTWRIATGIEWQCVKQVNLKLGGYYYEQVVGCIGIGLLFGHLSIDTNFEINPRLGLNIGARIGYCIP
ncbi:MAG: hypothetical protein MJZ75_06185 [Paludibacteraceae bacterium]|nr:hypothetical protein [Paludibacteraceae bacterium]